jgi:hypothetical protein
MNRWTGSVHQRWAAPPVHPVRAALALALAATALGGCTDSHSHPAAAGQSPATRLTQAAGALDAENTFRLTMDALIPQGGPTATAPPASAAPRPGPSVAPRTEAVKMSGVWDVGTGLARMDGTIDAVKTTILSAAGVEYVSLTSDVVAASGRKWLKSDDANATFGDFCQPQLVAQLLRAYHEVHVITADHLAGTVETAEADAHIADPVLIASLAGLPDKLRFDVWTDGSGAPTAVQFTFTGSGAVTTGTARLDSFGVAPAQVSVPTINQVVQAPGG